MAETENNSSLISKLVKATESIGAIEKDGKNQRQGYKFQSESAIKSAVKRAITSVGLAIIPSYEVTRSYEQQAKSGSMQLYVDVLGTFVITDGDDKIVGSMPGTGQDTGDKAVQKACTSAQKYFYKQLFNISDQDDDPDMLTSEPIAEPQYAKATNEQIAMITEGVNQMDNIRNGTGEKAKSYYLSETHVNRIEDLSKEQAQGFIALINRKIKEYQAAAAKNFDNAFEQQG